MKLPQPLSLRLLIFLTTFMTGTASAKLLDIPINDLVLDSDVGVIGRLTDVRKSAGWGIVYGSGIIEVDQVLFGNISSKKAVPIEWIIYPEFVQDDDLARFTSNQIWLLKTKNGVAIETLWQKVLDPSREMEVLEAAKNPLRAMQVREEGITTYVLRLIYRNETTATVELPAIESGDKQLLVPVGTHLEYIRYTTHLWQESDACQSSTGVIEYTSAPKMISVKPGSAHNIISFNFYDLFPVRDTYVSFRWSMPDHGHSNIVHVKPMIKYDNTYNEAPLWLRVKILMSYSPTRETIAGLVLGALTIFSYYIGKRGRRVQQ